MKKGSKKKIPKYVILVNHWCVFYKTIDRLTDNVKHYMFCVGAIFEIVRIEKRAGQKIVHLLSPGENCDEYEVNLKYFKESFRLLPEMPDCIF